MPAGIFDESIETPWTSKALLHWRKSDVSDAFGPVLSIGKELLLHRTPFDRHNASSAR